MQEKNKMNKFIYLDAAATMQKSERLVDAQAEFLREKYANSGRGVCARVGAVDDMVRDVRNAVARFMNAKYENIVFTSGTTDAINRIVNILKPTPDSVVAVSDLDHHSARLPFQMSGAKTVIVSLDEKLNIDTEQIPYADIFVVTAMSNVLGVAQNIPEIVRRAREKNPNVVVIVDAAQYVVHKSIDVIAWDADFVAWSGHKIGADTGIGVMYIKHPSRFMPDKFGGGMVNTVSRDGVAHFMSPPECFEAGTLPLTQISGLGVAISEIQSKRADLNLIGYLYDELSKLERVKILTRRDACVFSFVIDDMHVLDFGVIAGAHNICVRVGNMCASWIHRVLNIDGSIRVSVGPYNTKDDIDAFIDVVRGCVK